MTAPLPRGLSLNNPMNLMSYPTITWQGEVKPTTDPEGRLCQFDTVVDGIRAGALTLLAYYNKDGCTTIDDITDSTGQILHHGIIPRYAPPPTLAPGDKNPTAAYVAFMAQYCNVGPTANINVNDPNIMRLLCGGITRFEQGIPFAVSLADMTQGISEAIGQFFGNTAAQAS